MFDQIIIENVQFYAEAFKQIFDQCRKDNVVLHWSDTERKGLGLAVDKTTAENLMIGSLVHHSRSYQHVADRISSSVPVEIC